MIDLNNETLLTLAQAARRLPHRPHCATLYRWISRGLRGVKLEAARIGGKTCTSAQALQRFSDRLTSLDRGSAELSEFDTSATRRAAEAEAELERAGF